MASGAASSRGRAGAASSSRAGSCVASRLEIVNAFTAGMNPSGHIQGEAPHQAARQPQPECLNMTYAIQGLTPQDLPLARRIHATPWQRLIRTLRIRRQARATRHALDRLDDHMLKDIGLTRCDVWARA